MRRAEPAEPAGCGGPAQAGGAAASGVGRRMPNAEFVALMAILMGLSGMAIDLMLPAFPQMREQYGLVGSDATAISWMLTAFFLGLAAGQLVYGPLSDRFGRRPLLYAGLALYAASALASAFAPSFALLMACRVLWGLGAAGPRSLALAIVRDSYGGERMARTLSYIMTVFLLVPIFAPAFGALLMAVFPWHAVLWFPSVVAAIAALWLLRLPETLPPSRRRSVHPGALVGALGAVLRSRSSVLFAVTATFLYGVLFGYVGSSEIMVDEVFGLGDIFPTLYGAMASLLAVGSLSSARLVMRLGLRRLLRGATAAMAVWAGLFGALALATGGHPPFWAFFLTAPPMIALMMVVVPNANTAAMTPLPHVAGMASAVLGAVSTAGGALLASFVDGAYDGSITPFALLAVGYAAVAAVSVVLATGRWWPGEAPPPAGLDQLAH